MRFTDVRQVPASAGQVWTALHDREVLHAVIPGCERLSPLGAGRYSATLAARVGRLADTYHGTFVRLVLDEQVVETLEFETADPGLQGVMTMTTTLTDAAGGGTDVRIEHEGLPDAVPAADNETGTRMALANLAALVEGR